MAKKLSLPERILLCLAAASVAFSVGFAALSGREAGERVLFIAAREGAEKPGGRKTVDINSASAGELETLPGIGPALAEAIVSYRERHGPFLHADSIMDVAGIGEAKFAALETYITAEWGVEL